MFRKSTDFNFHVKLVIVVSATNADFIVNEGNDQLKVFGTEIEKRRKSRKKMEAE